MTVSQPVSRVIAQATLTTRRTPVFLACLMATFMSAIESTIVATAMPSIVGSLGGFQLFSWVFSVYMLSQAISIPICGRLADLYGRKVVFYAGTALFLLSSALCGFAPGMIELVVFRILQGLGAGGVQPVASIIVGDLYSPEERARMQGAMSTVYGVAAVAGPSLGAVLVQYAGWQAVFWVNLPIGIVAVLMMHHFLNENVQVRPHKVDYAGTALLMLTIGALTLAAGTAVLAFTHGHGNDRLTALGDTVVGCIALLGLIWHERRAPEPILPFRLWRERIIAVSSLGGGAVGALMMGTCAFLPAYVQGAMGETATIAGLVLGTMSVFWTIASLGTGAVLARSSYRATVVMGALLLVAGMLELIAMTPERGPVWAAVGAALIGVGVGFCNTSFTVATQSAVSWEQRGAATSSVMFLRCLGQAMGAALFGAVVNLSLASHDPTNAHAIGQLMTPDQRTVLPPLVLRHVVDATAQSIQNAYLLGAVLAVIALLLALRLPAGLRPSLQPQSA